jgi:hypothetical protein
MCQRDRTSRKLLVIGHQWPEPEATAAGQRMLQLIRGFLGHGYEITFGSPAASGSYDFPLESLGVKRIPLQLNDSSFDRFLSNSEFDVVLFDRFITEEQFGWRVRDQQPGCMTVLDTEDLHSLRHSREKALREGREWTAERWIEDPMFFRELASILRCDLSLIVSRVEQDLLSAQLPLLSGKLLFMPFQLARPAVQEHRDFEDRSGFVFVGNGKHRPNTDAITHLKRVMWPMISARLPEAELHIYGAYLPEAILRLHAPGERFHVRGWAPRLDQVFQKRRLQVAPLRFGAGIKGKILNALQYGVPTLTTPVGLEGICNDGDQDGVVAGTDLEFADLACRLYGEKASWMHALQVLEAASQPHFTNTFKQLADRIEERERWQNSINPEALMLQKMLGSLAFDRLRYLSKWIEEKEKRSI